MKIKLLGFLLLSAIAMSCGDSKEKKENETLKAEIQGLKQENASLKSGELKMKNSIDEVNDFLKQIEKNLASIDQNKTMITKLSGEKKDKKDVKENIKSHISTIKELVENSKLKIIALDRAILKLRQESGDKSAEILALDKQVKGLTNDLLDKDIQIEVLDNELEDMEELYEMELKKSAELWSIVNRAYYVVNTAKDLKTAGIVNKEGGFIGLGKVKVMNANASDALFTEIKKDETSELMLNAKKAKVISNHPDGSYEIKGEEGMADVLVILDRKLFWKEGNYLVVEVEK
ncbi:MAG: hypothetical protein ABJH05_15375 [Fulvivirga sp.]